MVTSDQKVVANLNATIMVTRRLQLLHQKSCDQNGHQGLATIFIKVTGGFILWSQSGHQWSQCPVWLELNGMTMMLMIMMAQPTSYL